MQLPLFQKHSGIWEGTYKRIDAAGELMWEHKSRLTLRLDGSEWRQSNLYEFPDGRVEFHNFGLALFDEKGVMTFDNPRIYGKSWETDCSILLWWTYKAEQGTKLYEIINLIDEKHRMRVWQHSRNGVFEGLTMIEEWKVAEQSAIPFEHYEEKSYILEAETV